MMKKIEKHYLIEATKNEVLEALTNPVMIEKWSGSPAKMDTSKNGIFELWGGGIHGRNLEITSVKVEQKWKEKKWDHYSKVSIIIEEDAGDTRVHLIHEEIPDNAFEAIYQGWDEYYMGPLKYYLENN